MSEIIICHVKKWSRYIKTRSKNSLFVVRNICMFRYAQERGKDMKF